MAAENKKPDNQRDIIDQLWYAVVGTNGEGLVSRMTRVETKVDEHQKWHAANRIAISLAIFGWVVAIVMGAVALI